LSSRYPSQWSLRSDGSTRARGGETVAKLKGGKGKLWEGRGGRRRRNKKDDEIAAGKGRRGFEEDTSGCWLARERDRHLTQTDTEREGEREREREILGDTRASEYSGYRTRRTKGFPANVIALLRPFTAIRCPNGQSAWELRRVYIQYVFNYR